MQNCKVRFHPNRIELLEPFHIESVPDVETSFTKDLVVTSYWGTDVPIYQLRYWDVEKQICFASIEGVMEYKKQLT